MGLFQWLFRPTPRPGTPFVGVGREQLAAVANQLNTYEIGKAKWPESNLSGLASTYRNTSLIFRCLSLITHNVGTAPMRVYDEATDDDEVADHPMRLLLKQPNPLMGEAKFWATVSLRAGVAGFCVVEKERDRIGNVIALNPLKSQWLKAVARGRGRYDWQYKIPGVTEAYTLKAEDVIPFTWADTVDGSPYGMPPLATCMRDAAILDKLTNFLAVLFERGGVPMYGLIPDPEAGTLDQEGADTMIGRFIARRGGLDRSAIPMILEGIKDVKRLSFDMDELALTDIRDVSELAIVNAFGVPPRKAGIRVGLEHTTQNATASVEDAEFYRDTIVPLWTRFDDAMTSGLLYEYETLPTTRYLEFDDSEIDALQEDRNAKAVWLIQGFSGGAFSHHSLHRELGLALPTTDDFYLRSIALEAIPVDDPLMKKPENAPPPPPKQLPPPTVKALPPAADNQGLSALTWLKATGPAERLAIAATNRKAIAKIANARRASIQTFLNAQKDRVLANLRQPTGVRILVGQNGHAREMLSVNDINWDTENKQLQAVMDRLYLLAGTTAFKAASDQTGVGLSWDLSNPRIRDVMNTLGVRVTDINETTRQDIASVITKGGEAGRSVDQIADDLSGLFDETYAGRALTIARTESMVSYGEASILGYKESGVVDRAQILDNPAHTDSYGASDGLTCAQRDGIIVPLDQAMEHIYADHPNGSACAAPVLAGE